MKCLFHSFFNVYLFTLISVSTLLAQSPDAMITRDQYLDKLEERFRSASSELSEISGVEFSTMNSPIFPTNKDRPISKNSELS